MITEGLRLLSAAGGPAHPLASHLDLARSIGPRGVMERWRQRQRVTAPAMDRAHTSIYRRIWTSAATSCGADLEDLPSGFLLIRRGASRTLVWRNLVMIDHPVTMRLSLDKPIVQRLLDDAALPVLENLELSAGDLQAAVELVAMRGGRFVVKPANASGGLGVTCGVELADDVRRAALLASRWDHRLVIERQAAGVEYRVLVLDGSVLGVVRRRPPQVVGDGSSTVLELISAENRRRLAACGDRGSRLVTVDLDSVLTLRSAGLSPRSIPAAGTVVAVKTSVSDNGPADSETVVEIAEGLATDAVRAAAAVGLRFAGIDLVTPDPGRSLAEAGGVILEVNSPPGIHYHYLVNDPGRVTPVAVPLLAALLDEGPIAASLAGATPLSLRAR